MRTKIALITSLAALGALVPAAALAQDAAPPAAPPASAAPAAPAAAEAAPAAAPAPAPAPAPEAAPAGPKPAPGWMRIDSDFFGLQMWGGGTFPLTDTIGLAMDIYVNAVVPPAGSGGSPTIDALGEYDLGPAITAGPFVLTPMLGFQADFTNRHAQALVPQFYVTGGPGPIYGEFWFQFYDNKIFNKDVAAAGMTPAVVVQNQINMRLFADYKFSDYVAVGPELDLNYDTGGYPNSKGATKKVYNLPIGPNFMFSNLGAGSSLIAFLGYETGDPTALGHHLAGRLTYVHNF
jgi:hypothetical protein